MHRNILATLGLALAAALTAHAGSPPQPFTYEPSISTVTGVIKNDRVFFGPPGYGENPKEDAKEVPERLVLDEPIAIAPHPSEPATQPVTGVTELQIVKGDAAPSLEPFLGKRVRIVGKLFEAHTGHHHTPALIAADRIELLRKK